MVSFYIEKRETEFQKYFL